jgi:hypothetical protein
MSFLTFFLYFLVSSLCYELLVVLVWTLKKRYQTKQLQNAIAKGKIKLMTMEEYADQMEEEEKKTWN